MAATLVQSAKGLATTAVVAPILPAASTTGNLIVLAFASDDYNGTPDSGWTQSFDMEQQTFHGGYIWWRISTGQTAFQYTIGSATNSAWVIAEFSGVDAAPYDISDGQFNQTSVGSYTTPNITPSTGERLLVAMIGQSLSGGVSSAPGSWTNSFTQVQSQQMGGTGTIDGCGMAYRIVTGDGSTTFSTGASWSPVCQSQSGLIISLKGAAVAPSTPTGLSYSAPNLTWTDNTSGGSDSFIVKRDGVIVEGTPGSATFVPTTAGVYTVIAVKGGIESASSSGLYVAPGLGSTSSKVTDGQVGYGTVGVHGTGSAPVALSGTAVGTGATTASLTASPKLSGTAAGTGAAIGALKAFSQLSATSAGSGAATGSLTAAPKLSGTAAGTGTATGALITAPKLSGTAAGLGAATGSLTASAQLSGSSAGAGSVTGSLTAAPKLSGTAAGASTATGSLSVASQLSGTAVGIGTATGSLTAAVSAQEFLPDADTVTTGWTITPLFSKLNDDSDATVVTATLV